MQEDCCASSTRPQDRAVRSPCDREALLLATSGGDDARPGRIKDVIEVALPRPRSLEMINSKEFGRCSTMSFTDPRGGDEDHGAASLGAGA